TEAPEVTSSCDTETSSDTLRCSTTTVSKTFVSIATKTFTDISKVKTVTTINSITATPKPKTVTLNQTTTDIQTDTATETDTKTTNYTLIYTKTETSAETKTDTTTENNTETSTETQTAIYTVTMNQAQTETSSFIETKISKKTFVVFTSGIRTRYDTYISGSILAYTDFTISGTFYRTSTSTTISTVLQTRSTELTHTATTTETIIYVTDTSISTEKIAETQTITESVTTTSLSVSIYTTKEHGPIKYGTVPEAIVYPEIQKNVYQIYPTKTVQHAYGYKNQ
ncbi:hypothetical protein BB559_006422, partial [Furculomyces boomerangus]